LIATKGTPLTPTDTPTDSTETQLETSEDQAATSLTAETHDHTHDHDHAGHDHAGHDHEGHSQEPAVRPLNPECRREVEAVIPAAEVDATFDTVLKRYRKQARIPGFRAGKVPESVLRRRFAEDLKRDVVESLLPKYFSQAIEQQGLRPVSQPRLVELHFEEKEPLKFKAEFEVVPPFEVTGYNDVHIEKPDTSLTDDEFQQEITRLLESRYTMEPLPDDHVLTDGDFAQISFKGHIAGEDESLDATDPANNLSGNNALVEIGGKDTVEAFTTSLRGATPGQSMQLEVNYPEDFGEKKLAGKTVTYDLEVNGAKHKVIPELNEELVNQLGGDYSSVDDFNQKFRELLASTKTRRLEGEAKNKLLEALTQRFNFPVPETLIAEQVEARLERGLRALASQGMRSEQMRQLDFTRLRAGQHDAAAAEVKSSLIVDKIADLENVQVTDEEMERELLVASQETGEPVETLRKRLTEDGTLARIREQIRREKTTTLLYGRQP
jgi:trigger factor